MENEWIKYFQGELTTSEKEALFSKIEKEQAGWQDFAGLNNTWALSMLTQQKQDEETALNGKKRFFQRRKRRNIRTFTISLLRYAAIICIVFSSSWYLATYFSNKNKKIRYTEINVPAKQHLHITLTDGTLVRLSPRSRLKIPNHFQQDNRVVELDGEGLFTVAEDDKKPFIVKSKGYNIEVLSTKFNLFSYSENSRYEVHLIDGEIQAYGENNKENAVLLAPNEKVSLVNNQLVKSESDYGNDTFLSDGIYNFNATPFIDILEHLSLWYDVCFETKNPELFTTKVSAKFRLNDDIENILIALQNVFQFNFKRLENNVIEISK